MENVERSRQLIKQFLGKRVEAQLDGVIFDDQPNTFAFRFSDPDELRAEVAEIHCDEMDMEPWNEVVPVAAVSVPERSTDEFAWVFLDWREGDQPTLLVATSDNWGGSLSAASLEELGITVA